MRQDVASIFNPNTPAPTFEAIRISIASPEQILSWSSARSKSRRPSTIARSSLSATVCSARASSAPQKDYECLCGKYKRMKYQGRDLREVRRRGDAGPKVRRERMGHIELAAPVAHIWFLKSLPSRIAGCCSTSS
jgi:DNA-directed RNA polymerase subunit beta'